jgi:hypothetical protein
MYPPISPAPFFLCLMPTHCSRHVGLRCANPTYDGIVALFVTRNHVIDTRPLPRVITKYIAGSNSRKKNAGEAIPLHRRPSR